MCAKQIMKSMLPHVAAIAVFYVLTITYFYPVFFENKDLVQGDIVSYQGWAPDAKEHYKETGEYCYWTNAMFGGMPTNMAYAPRTNNVFLKVDSLFMGFLPGFTAGCFFAYLLGFYVFMLTLGMSPLSGTIGAIAYAFASYNLIIIDAGHISKALVMSTMAPVLGGVILCYRGKLLKGILLTTIAVGLNVLWNHQQISYYLILMLIVMAIVYLIYAVREHTVKAYLKRSAILLSVALLAAAPAVDKLIPTIDYTKDTMRGGPVLKENPEGKKETTGLDIDYAYQWSYGKMESMTLLIPNFYGASSHYNIGNDSELYEALRPTGQGAQFCRQAPMYWGDQPFTSGTVYAGAIICLLFVFGIIVVEGKEKWWLLVVTVISLVLSWGRNYAVVNDFLFHYLPLYNKFRTPSMALVMAEVSMVTLAMLAIKQMIESEERRAYLKPLYISLGITGGLCMFFALFGGTLFTFTSPTDARYPDWLQSAFVSDRAGMLRGDAWRSLAFILSAAGLIWLYIHKTVNSKWAAVILGVLILTDLWSVDKRFLNKDNFKPVRTAKTIEPTPTDIAIMEDTDPNYRVLNLATNTFNESVTSCFHKSIGGYSPAKLRRYQDIIDYHISGRITPNVLNMLNTKYIIARGQDGQTRIQHNPDAMGNVWFVDRVEWQNTPDDEIKALYDADLRHVALMDIEWKDDIRDKSVLSSQVDSNAHISMKEYANPGNIIYEASTPKAQLAIFSEVQYKTWRAYIDGEETPILRANYILRAIEIPAGDHIIEFKCVDELFEKTHVWSMIFSILVSLVVVSCCGLMVYRQLKKTDDKER